VPGGHRQGVVRSARRAVRAGVPGRDVRGACAIGRRARRQVRGGRAALGAAGRPRLMTAPAAGQSGDAAPGTNRVVGRTALVTGAGYGLGRAIALALAGAGARVVLVGRQEGKLVAVAGELPEGRSRVATCDTSDPAAVDRLREELSDEEV